MISILYPWIKIFPTLTRSTNTTIDSTTSGEFPISNRQEAPPPPLIQHFQVTSPSRVGDYAKIGNLDHLSLKSIQIVKKCLLFVIDGVNFHHHKVI
ncbi:hypothetical protein R6Q57_025836 [Mikania cordata]